MGYSNLADAACTNCDYKGYVRLWNGELFGAKKVCPKCGFKSLGDGWQVQLTQHTLDQINKQS